jgi:thiamine biosynthesis lipoprotein
VAGRSPEGDGWTIGIDHPGDVHLAAIGIASGGVATSTSLIRTLGGSRHHIVDPISGEPTESGVRFVTVIAAAAWIAEAHATAAMVAGPDYLDELERIGVDALVEDDRGRIRTTDGFEAFTGGAPKSSELRGVRT